MKNTYSPPETEELFLTPEGIICQSEVPASNEIDGWGDGGTVDDMLNL